MAISKNISKNLDIVTNAFGRGTFPHQMSWFLDLPGRQAILSRKLLASRLPLRPDSQVLEVGPGSGYYSAAVAKKIPKGELVLFDIQQEMLDKCEKKLSKAGLANFSTQLSEGETLPFEDNSFDVVYMVTVFGEISEQAPFLSELNRVLKKDGVLSITEHHPDPDFESSKKVISKLERAGFVITQKLGWRWAYTLNASK